MSFFNNFSQGISIGFQCMGYVLHYPTLLIFTAIPTFFNTFFVVSAFNTLLRYTNVIDTIREAHSASHPVVQLHGQLPHSFITLILVFIITRLLSTLFTASLQYYIKDTLDNTSPSMMRSIGNALSHIFSLFFWGFISIGARLFINNLSGNNSNQVSNIGRSIVGSALNTAWSFATVFVIPFIIFSNQNVFSAMYSSYEVVKNNFSQNTGALLSIVGMKRAINSVIFLLCLPAAAMIYYSVADSGQLSDAAIYNYIMIAIGLIAIPNLIAFPFKHAANNILAVVLYNRSQNKNVGPFGSLFQ